MQMMRMTREVSEKVIFPSSFEGEKSGRNIADFVIEDKIVVELKARSIVLKEDYFQVQRYLTSSNKKLGILFNFRQKYIRPKRIINTKI